MLIKSILPHRTIPKLVSRSLEISFGERLRRRTRSREIQVCGDPDGFRALGPAEEMLLINTGPTEIAGRSHLSSVDTGPPGSFCSHRPLSVSVPLFWQSPGSKRCHSQCFAGPQHADLFAEAYSFRSCRWIHLPPNRLNLKFRHTETKYATRIVMYQIPTEING